MRGTARVKGNKQSHMTKRPESWMQFSGKHPLWYSVPQVMQRRSWLRFRLSHSPHLMVYSELHLCVSHLQRKRITLLVGNDRVQESNLTEARSGGFVTIGALLSHIPEQFCELLLGTGFKSKTTSVSLFAHNGHFHDLYRFPFMLIQQLWK